MSTFRRRGITVAIGLSVSLPLSLAILAPVDAAYRVAASTADKRGDVHVEAGSPGRRQQKMSDLRALSVRWADATHVVVGYRVPHRGGNGPSVYPARDDVVMDYVTDDSETAHRALLAVDPLDSSAGPSGLMTMDGPHVEEAEADGADCVPSYESQVRDDRTEVFIGVPVACLGDPTSVSRVKLLHVTRHQGAWISDKATLATSATVPTAGAWRRLHVKDKAGDARRTVPSWPDEKFADVLALRETYFPGSGRINIAVKLAKIARARGPRQRLTLDIMSDDGSVAAVGYVPGSAGRAGSFELLSECDGETSELRRKRHTVVFSIPASCVGEREMSLDVWAAALRGSDENGASSGWDYATDSRAGILLY